MSAFFLFDNREVTDPDALADYARDVAPVVAEFGGRYRSVGGPVTTVEGDWDMTYPVIIEFPTADQARRWYESDAYRPLKARRQAAVRGAGVLIEGTDD